jgi:hypothetical protein
VGPLIWRIRVCLSRMGCRTPGLLGGWRSQKVAAPRLGRLRHAGGRGHGRRAHVGGAKRPPHWHPQCATQLLRPAGGRGRAQDNHVVEQEINTQMMEETGVSLSEQKVRGSSIQIALWTSTMIAGEERWMAAMLKWDSTKKSAMQA